MSLVRIKLEVPATQAAGDGPRALGEDLGLRSRSVPAIQGRWEVRGQSLEMNPEALSMRRCHEAEASEGERGRKRTEMVVFRLVTCIFLKRILKSYILHF